MKLALRLLALFPLLAVACKRAPPPAVEDEAACVDRWLEAKGLDGYGNPAGTMYAGGSPLFDERTGQAAPRLPYVYRQRPEVKAACAGADAGGGLH